MLCLTILFIRKLITVYKNTERSLADHDKDTVQDNSFVKPITKLTVLLSLSIISTILNMIGITQRAFIKTELSRFVVHTLAAIDLYSNFVNVMLTYNVFDKYYYTICGSVDNLCRACWMRAINGKSDIGAAQLNIMMTDGSSTSPTTDTCTSSPYTGSPDVEIGTSSSRSTTHSQI